MTRPITLDHPDFPLNLRIPGRTPTGAGVHVDERAGEMSRRFHYTSVGSDEVYFEIGRYPDRTPAEVMDLFIEDVTDRIEGIVVGEPEPAVVAGYAAVRLRIGWPGKQRLVHFLSVDGNAYRVILDPASPLNFEILATLEFTV
jgi:hypothetical protein